MIIEMVWDTFYNKNIMANHLEESLASSQDVSFQEPSATSTELPADILGREAFRLVRQLESFLLANPAWREASSVPDDMTAIPTDEGEYAYDGEFKIGEQLFWASIEGFDEHVRYGRIGEFKGDGTNLLVRSYETQAYRVPVEGTADTYEYAGEYGPRCEINAVENEEVFPNSQQAVDKFDAFLLEVQTSTATDFS